MMGTLLGHALPGSFFLLFAVWRLVQTVRRQQLLRHFRPNDDVTDVFYTSATFPCYVGRLARWPVEGIFKVLLTGVGMAGELWASTDYGNAGRIVSIGDIQHVTMYSLFFLSGVVDMVVWCCPYRRRRCHDDNDDVIDADPRPDCLRRRRCCGRLVAPPGVEFVAMALAFVGEALLFSQHTHGRGDFDRLLHVLLVCVLAATVLSVFVECRYRRSLAASLTTTFLIFVQGVWFIQVGLLLYPPANTIHRDIQAWLYSLNDHDQTIMVTSIFSWHLASAFIFILTAYVTLHKLFALVCRCDCATNIDDLPYAEYSQISDEDICIDFDLTQKYVMSSEKNMQLEDGFRR